MRPVKDMGYLEGKPLDFKVIKVDKKEITLSFLDELWLKVIIRQKERRFSATWQKAPRWLVWLKFDRLRGFCGSEGSRWVASHH